MALLILHMQPASGDAAINVPAATFRQLTRGLITEGAARGLIAPASAKVTQRGAGANFSVDVQPLVGIVDGTDVTDQGSYLIVNTSVVNVVTPSAPASGTRTHRLIAQVRDKRSNGTWTTYDWTPVLLQDTGAGEPSLPASAQTLAHITIAAGQASVTNAAINPGYNVLKDLSFRGPWQSLQSAAGSWGSNNAWNDFSAGNWAPVVFTVPPSGKVWVSISAAVIVAAGNASVGWRISGGDGVGNSTSRAFTASGVGTNRGTRRCLVTGLTPGATDTVTPGWFQTAGGNSDDGNSGDLSVEPVD